MREILFRAKRIDDGEWVEGFLLSTNEHTYIAYTNQFDDDLFLSPKEIFIEVDPKTVCQYTGLTDKNGRKIFAGDIVKVLYTNGQEDGGDVTEVKYSEKSASFSPWDWEYDCDGCDLYFHIKEIEIIGNAFDKE